MTSMPDLIEYYKTLVTNNKTDLGVTEVFIGDQRLFQGPVTVCVESDTKTNVVTRAAGGRSVDSVYRIYLLVYCNSIEDYHLNRKNTDIVADKVESLVYSYPTCQGKVYKLEIEQIESGYITRENNKVVAAARLTILLTERRTLPISLE